MTSISRDELMCTTRCPKVKVAVKIAQLPSAIPVDKGLLVDAASSEDVSVLIPADGKTAAVNDSGSKCVLQEDKNNGVDENVCNVSLKIWWFMPCVDQKTPQNDFTKSICQFCALSF